MNKGDTLTKSFTPLSYAGDEAQNIVRDFNDAVRALGATKDALEQKIADLRVEADALKRERVVLEADMGEAREASQVAMAAKASEEEKQDALKKNQELRSYLDSAADTIKTLGMKVAGESNEVKRLGARIKHLESEKISLVKEREELHAQMLRMNAIIREQDWKVKNSSLRSESWDDDKKFLKSELAATQKELRDIQESMLSVKDKMRKTYSDEPQT